MRFAVLVTLILVASASAAYGHGGAVILDQTGQRYSVRATAINVDEGIDLTTYVVRRDLGEPDDNADVRLTLTTPDGTKTVKAEPVAGGYEAVVDGSADEWRDWRVKVDVSGAAGDATFSAGPIGRDPVPVGPLAAVTAILIAVGGGLVILRRRKRIGEHS